MTHGVDTPMQGVQPPTPESVIDCPPPDSDLPQLAVRDHAVLAFGHLSDSLISRPDHPTSPLLIPYDGVNGG